MLTTLRDRLRVGGDDGVALIAVVMVSMVALALVAVVLGTGEHADHASTRDRNSELALGVAEAGVQEAIAKIEAYGGTSAGFNFSGQTPEGTYQVTVSRTLSRYTVVSGAEVGGESARARKRKVKVTLAPPRVFHDTLFSNTSIQLKNNDTITGDVWANDSVLLEGGGLLKGSLTAARSWIHIQSNSEVTGEIWSGGYTPSTVWAIKLESGVKVGGSVKASVSAPTDPVTCGNEQGSNYHVPTDNGVAIAGDLRTWGAKTGPGVVSGTYTSGICTAAAIPRPLPVFTFNQNNYDPATFHAFGSVAEFQTWLSGNLADLRGTFYIAESSPSQVNRIDLTGAKVTGDVTIVTGAPVFTNGVEEVGTTPRLFVVASSYQPPVGSACDVDQDASECAVHLKNNFKLINDNCITATLIYANRGPVAVKNGAEQCGSIYADSILVKNNQILRYDPRVAQVVGFGPVTYDVERWEELPPS
ncbi:MAG TPA: hypothetical protein VNE62_12085 [Actinomycetota bacterium]|nr:hypothetical protein [Actinomycetota bacterium]